MKDTIQLINSHRPCHGLASETTRAICSGDANDASPTRLVADAKPWHGAAARPRDAAEFAGAGPAMRALVLLLSCAVALWAGVRAAAQAPAGAAPAVAQSAPIVIDDFADVSKWKVVASDGVEGKISLAEGTTCPEGTDGKALRLDFDFKKGSGYCIVRRELDLTLPQNYRVGFSLLGSSGVVNSEGKAEGFVNDLEFKFYDQTGDNVWWVRTPDHRYAAKWERTRYFKRQLDFAWGPGGGKVPLERLTAIEFAVTVGHASQGGKGYILLDTLTMEPLGVSPREHGTASILINGELARDLEAGEARALILVAPAVDAIFAEKRTLSLDFGGPSEFGGLLIEWEGDAGELTTSATTSLFPGSIEPWFGERILGGIEPSLLVFRDVEASRVDLAFQVKDAKPRTIKRLSLLPRDAGTNPNSVARITASISPRGWYPRQFLGEQMAWAPIGNVGEEFEALLSSDGQVELCAGGPTIEPFLRMRVKDDDIGGALLSWGDFTSRSMLQSERLPMPGCELSHPAGIAIKVEPIASPGTESVVVKYTVRNTGRTPRTGTLLLALRPFQVLPHWHTLNLVGGVAPEVTHSSSASARDGTIRVGGAEVVAINEADQNWISFGSVHDVVRILHHRLFQLPNRVGRANSAALGFNFDLRPDHSKVVWVLGTAGRDALPQHTQSTVNEEREKQIDRWSNLLSHTTLKLPPQAKELEDSFYAQIGWILVNKDGPAIQPGSRTYDRTWIRDGALTATALLYTGHADEVKEFLDWFRTFQYEDGKIPCCVDQRGPDPVPEHDSHGQYIYGVATYHRFTHDDDLLKRHWGNVAAAVGYIEKLRATRMTAEYADPSAPPETRVKYGLMPESISHEGYSAKPMHSYWDGFFTLRGLTDAVYIAEKLGENATAAKWAALRDDFARTLTDSIRLAQKIKNVPYVPGCAELGDEDPTSTAAAIFPGGVGDGPLADSLRVTFDRYIQRFRDRRDGKIEWRDYTPYEMRNASALLMLGRPDQAHEVLDWMLEERASVGWRMWAEIGYKDKKTGKFVGDMPHTWVGSDYVKAVRNLCVYERERDHALVIGAGLKPDWLADAQRVTVGGFPTEHGVLSYKASMTGKTITFDIEAGTIKVPPGGLVVMPMALGGIKSATINGKPAEESGPGHVTVRTLPARVEITLN